LDHGTRGENDTSRVATLRVDGGAASSGDDAGNDTTGVDPARRPAVSFIVYDRGRRLLGVVVVVGGLNGPRGSMVSERVGDVRVWW